MATVDKPAELSVATKLRDEAKAKMEKAEKKISEFPIPQNLTDALAAARKAIADVVPAALRNERGKAKAAYLMWDEAVVSFGGETTITASKPGRKPANAS